MNAVAGDSEDLTLTVDYAPDGKTVASAGTGGTISLWDPVTGERRASFEGSKRVVRSFTIAPDGKTLVSSGDDAVVRLWDPVQGTPLRTFPGLSEAIRQSIPDADIASVAFSKDGSSIAIGGGGGHTQDEAVFEERLFETETGKLKWAHMGRGEWAFSVAYSPDRKSLAVLVP
ncbi:WD40 repeat domain-containing protein [Singulisphaera rosea]